MDLRFFNYHVTKYTPIQIFMSIFKMIGTNSSKPF